MPKEINEYLKDVYPDVTPDTIESLPAERRKQYERDSDTVLENFEEFNEKLNSGKDAKSALYQVKFSKYMDKLFPGYKEMSFARQEECEFRFGLGNLNFTEIDAIYGKLTDPEDPMYQPGLSEKDAANVAAIYAKAYLQSQQKVGHPTGRQVHDPNDWFKPVDEVKYYDPTEHEQVSALTDAIAEYNKKNRFSIKNILSGTKKHNITIDAALHAKDYLSKALNPAQIDHDKSEVEAEF